MRIGLVVAQFPSYSETFFVNMIVGLCERGHHVTLFRSDIHKDRFLEDLYGLKKLPNLNIVTLNFKSSFFSLARLVAIHPFIFLKSFDVRINRYKKKVFKNLSAAYFKKSKCDIYHFGFSGIGIFYLPVFDLLSARKVVSCFGSAEKVKPLTETGRTDKMRTLFIKADRIHCISSDMVQTIKQYGAADEKIYINRSAIDINIFKRKNGYTSQNKIQILSIARLIFQKGFLIGLMAIKELKKEFPDFVWKIVGEGREKDQIIFYIHEFGLEHHVELLGKKTRHEVIKLYEESDIYFLPSVYEGIANVALEAMAMKLPVVSSYNGGMDEVIAHNVDGMLSPNYDHSSMAKQLFELCNDFEKRKSIGERARKKIEAGFSLQRFIDVFEKDYLQLLSSQR